MENNLTNKGKQKTTDNRELGVCHATVSLSPSQIKLKVQRFSRLNYRASFDVIKTPAFSFSGFKADKQPNSSLFCFSIYLPLYPKSDHHRM